jgi:phosphoglycerate dehydrogenase-like enzyme
MTVSAHNGDKPTVMVVAHELDPTLVPLAAAADLRLCSDAQAIAATMSETDVLLAWDYELLPLLRGAWPQAGRLRWIHTSGIGVDGVQAATADRSDVVLSNARGLFEHAVAEYALTLLLTIAKGVPATLRDQSQQRWAPREVMLLRGRRALVLGAGSIGREVARLVRALGMRTTVVARTAREDDELGAIEPIARLAELLPAAEAVVCVLPLTAETDGIFDQAQIARMRHGALFVNVGRGDLVDEVALTAALADGRLRGVALDVFQQEPLPVESPLWTMAPTVVVSPHMGGEMLGWRAAVAQRFGENLERWRAGEPLLGAVDVTRIGMSAA